MNLMLSEIVKFISVEYLVIFMNVFIIAVNAVSTILLLKHFTDSVLIISRLLITNMKYIRMKYVGF